MTPVEAAAAYVAFVEGKVRAFNTVQTYQHTLSWLVKFLPDRDFAEIGLEDIASAWSAIAASERLGPNTLRVYRVVMATWLDWCVLHAGLRSHELRKIPLPKKVTPYRPKVTLQRMHALRTACDYLKSDYARVRALALLETLWSPMLRRDEMLTLRLPHLRLEDLEPRIKIECGKGGWSGWIFISDRAAAALRAWLIVRGDAGHDWLWCNTGKKRAPMGQKALYLLLTELAEIARIAVDECKPHALRRGASTSMLQSGQDIGTVCGWLRHKSIVTTMEYVEASTTKLGATRNWEDDANRAKQSEIDIQVSLARIHESIDQVRSERSGPKERVRKKIRRPKPKSRR